MVNEPKSMDDCLYFTRRSLGEKGFVKAWTLKQDCPKCGKDKMGKPVVKGKVKIRAKEYVCPACGYTVEKEAYEETLTCEAKFECPSCGKSGEGSIPFIRKRIQRKDEKTGKKKAVEVLRFTCSQCNENIDVSKKMK